MPGGSSRRLPRTLRTTSIPSCSGGIASTMPQYSGEMTGSTNRYAPLAGSPAATACPSSTPSSPNTPPTTPPQVGASSPAVEQPQAPKHFPFPNTPVDDDLFFEAMMFVFTVVAGALQFVHLYRTVWWLPHSYTSQALNFYLIDPNLVTFIMILLSRRLVYIIGCRLLDKFIPFHVLKCSHTFYKLVLFGGIGSNLSWCAYYVIQSHHIFNLLYLCYPILVYLLFFGFRISSFFELITWNDAPGSYSVAAPPLHACRSNAAEVRQEVENLKTNFNNRMKQILFNSVLNAYYAGFVPCCFAQSHLHYDVYWATQHVIFIFLSSFVAYCNHVLSLRYCDILHRSSLHLGHWEKLETRSHTSLVYSDWKGDNVLWAQGALVQHNGQTYRAQEECNASEPGNSTHSRFYFFFKNPSFSLGILLAFHLLTVLIQLVLLIRCVFWYNIISISLILFFNFYILHKLGRDYLVSSKMYEEERAMHNKINSVRYFGIWFYLRHTDFWLILTPIGHSEFFTQQCAICLEGIFRNVKIRQHSTALLRTRISSTLSYN